MFDRSSIAPSDTRSRNGTGSAPTTGDDLFAFVETILPHWRCITGDGLRATLRAIGEHVPIALTEVPSGTAVLDWTIPSEWRVREAYIATPDGTRVVDVADNPLHLVQYSAPTRCRLALADLRPRLHTLPPHPDWIPYRTDYYTDGWGFCLRQSALDALAAQIGEDGELDVVIDAELFEGSLTYGEVVVPGETDDEILISAHACHPSLANDNASSLAVATALARHLLDGPRPRHTIRFLFAPGTVGAIAWLAQHGETVGRIRHGLVLANLGDGGAFTYKQTRRGTLGAQPDIDRAVALVLREGQHPHEIRLFDPFGYDERQFNTPGFDLSVGRLTRTPHGEYPEYHTSADDLSLVQADSLAASLNVLCRIVGVLDGDRRYDSRAPFGEPQLGRHGLYQFPDGTAHPPDVQAAIAWVLNLSDGVHSLLDITEISKLPFAAVRTAANRLVEAGLLNPGT